MRQKLRDVHIYSSFNTAHSDPRCHTAIRYQTNMQTNKIEKSSYLAAYSFIFGIGVRSTMAMVARRLV